MIEGVSSHNENLGLHSMKRRKKGGEQLERRGNEVPI